MSLRAEAVSYSAGGRALVRDLTLALEPGKVHALIGPNGAGKSTLLRLLAGDLPLDAGEITLNGRAMARWTPRERARQRAVLPQRDSLQFGFTAAQVVALGRLPCPRHHAETEAMIVHDALDAAGVVHLARRKYPTLSGGERARVQFARVMAQIWEPVELGPRYLLLDEPTANLDLAHQHDCLRMARCFAAGGAGVLVVLHDPNLAMMHADEVTLMDRGRVAAHGAPAQALTADILHRIYGIRVDLVMPPNSDRPVIVARPSQPPRIAAVD